MPFSFDFSFVPLDPASFRIGEFGDIMLRGDFTRAGTAPDVLNVEIEPAGFLGDDDDDATVLRVVMGELRAFMDVTFALPTLRGELSV